MLQKLAPVLINHLTHIINQSLCTGVFPNRLKIAKVIPLFKKSDPHIVDNYRPISLLSSISKTFEKVVFNQVYAYFTNKDLFYNSQYGFRKLHSTEYASLEMVDCISQYLDNGKLPITVYLDLSKAFDTINHEILLKKIKYYGFADTPWNGLKVICIIDNSMYFSLERRGTFGYLRSINPNTINHFVNQSQTYQILKIKMFNGPAGNHHMAISASPCCIFAPHRKDFLLFFYIERKLWKMVEPQVNWWGSTLKLPFFKYK